MRAIQYPLYDGLGTVFPLLSAGDYWMPAFAGMTLLLYDE
jgi:hypothetical protein